MKSREWKPDPVSATTLATQGRSDRDRWRQPSSYSPDWDSRAKLAAEQLQGPVKILDLGAGTMNLRQFLPNGSEYIAADLEPLDKQALKIDLNTDPLPDDSYDVISMLGVFEYLSGREVLLKQICDRTRLFLISYCCLSGSLEDYKTERRALGWANDHTEREFLELVISAGFYHLHTVSYNQHPGCEQKIFLFCSGAEGFSPSIDLAESLNWHAELLGRRAQTLRWYRFVESLFLRDPDNIDLAHHYFHMAKSLGDQDAILSVGLRMLDSGLLDVVSAISVAEVARSKGEIFAALRIAAKVTPPDETPQGMVASFVASTLLAQGVDPEALFNCGNAGLHPIIRPDKLDLCNRAMQLDEEEFENLPRAEQLCILDSADLQGEIDQAKKFCLKMNPSEAGMFNIDSMLRSINASWDAEPTNESDSAASFGLLSYTTENIGDDIQSLAALRFLPPGVSIRLLNRDDLGREPQSSAKLIMGGWFGHFHKTKKDSSWPPNNFIDPIFLSFHVTPGAAQHVLSKAGIEYLSDHQPIGCRDLFTKNLLEANEIQAWVSGCLTSTIPRVQKASAKGPVTLVDLDHPMIEQTVVGALNNLNVQQVRRRTHDLRVGRLYPVARLKLAHELLMDYAASRLVITTRLHCAIPCAAMGVPVLFIVGRPYDERFSGMDLSGIRVDFSTFAENPELLIAARLDTPSRRPNFSSTLETDLFAKGFQDAALQSDFRSFEQFVQPDRLIC